MRLRFQPCRSVPRSSGRELTSTSQAAGESRTASSDGHAYRLPGRVRYSKRLTLDASAKIPETALYRLTFETVAGLVVIRCPTCGSDLVYSPIPPLFFCLDGMEGERIKISLKCEPWIAEDALVEDLLTLTDRIGSLARDLRV